jgi:hypothetical protein
VVGATVFIDQNNNNLLNAGERYTTTDKSGYWSFEDQGALTGDIVVFGGVDISTSQAVEGTIRAIAGTSVIQVETKLLTSSLRYTTGSVPPLTENSLTVTEMHSLRIFATFNQPIQAETIPIITINNGTDDIIQAASMNRVSESSYYYDLDVPIGDFIGTVSVYTQALQTRDVLAVTTTNTAFVVDNAPAILSAKIAFALDENSGENQVIYTVTSDDIQALYSLKDGGDRDLLSIDNVTGVVKLIGNPNFEIKPSYSFTVLASDTSGHRNSKNVTLAIHDVDEITPTVTGVSSSNADGRYKAGDNIAITVNFDEIVAVTGIPRLTLKIGAVEKSIDYVSGAGTTTLTFNYTVAATDATADLDYASRTALDLNGGSIKDSAGNEAVLTLAAPASAGSLAANKTIVVDNITPLLTSQSPTNGSTEVTLDSNINLTFNEAIALGTGLIRISSGSDSRSINVDSHAGQLSINGNTLTVNLNQDLTKGKAPYSVVVDSGAIVDSAGNAYAGLTNYHFNTAINTNTVVFALDDNKSSSHSQRTFDTDVDYNIYLRVNSTSANLNFSSLLKWTGGAILGTGDVIHLVGNNGVGVVGFDGQNVLSNGAVTELNAKVVWATATNGNAFELNQNGIGTRSFNAVTMQTNLWSGGANLALIGKNYTTNMPAGILTSQGLL